MDEAGDSWRRVLEQLDALKRSWPGNEWTWDGRFSTVASSFAYDLEPVARKSAMNALTRGWTTKSIDNAPPSLRAICDRTGGLREGQRLLAGDQDSLFGLWWPWGGGDTITLRIGFDSVEPVTRLRGLFGV